MIQQSDINQLASWFMPRGEQIVATLPTTGVTSGTLLYSSTWDSWAKYDGTRWLGPEVPMTWTDIRAFGPYAATGVVCQGVWPESYNVYATRLVVRMTVATTNDGANYWTCVLNTIRFDGVSTALNTENTGTLPNVAGTNYRYNRAINTVISSGGSGTTNQLIAQLSVNKNGAPGNLTMSAQLFYRPVLT